MFSTGGVTDEQLQAMWHACSEIAGEPDAAQACRRLADRLTAILGASAAVFRREVAPWKLFVAPPSPAAGSGGVPETLQDLVSSTSAGYLSLVGRGDRYWTAVTLEDDVSSQWLLLLPGDWRTGAAAQWLPRFVHTASIALRLAAARQTARDREGLAAIAYAFARQLGQVSGGLLHQVIVDAAARTARARLAGLSVYHAKEGAIVVTATHGYPTEAVGDVRIVPGTGIIGSVFSSKKPLLVRDTARVPGHTPASRRYQTASFMAIPIVAGEDALGVVTLADRSDGNPFTRHDLAAARVITALSALALVREQLIALSEDLAHTAAIDPLTAMFNRRYLETRLDAELEHSRRTGLPVALLMLDVDSFKSINDQMGHPTGDAVLRKVAEIIRRSVRASDVCTRYGGDEFSVIVSENAASADQTAERIRQRVAAYRWESLGLPSSIRVTISVGVGVGELGETPDALIGRADQYMYRAKALGRNRVYPEIR